MTNFAHLPIGPSVSIIAAAIAAVSLLASFIFYSKELAANSITSLVSYLLTLVLVFFAAIDTGFGSVTFIALLAIVASFASTFAWFGVGPVLFGAIGYIIWTAYAGDFAIEQLGSILVSTIVPLFIGWLALQQAANGKEGDKVYHELRNKLSSVSSQSGAIISAISNGILSVDARNSITLINPAATTMIGWTKEDAVGLDYRTIFKLNDARDQPISESQHPIQLAHTTGKEVKTDTLFLVTTDSSKRVQVSITATPLSDGGVIVIFRDVTEERAEEREQAEFISTASHEMRTPVASIEGFLGLALNPATAQVDERARGFIGKAHESAQHLGRLFQDLLDVSKADDGRMQNNPKIIDVTPFIHDIIVGLLPKAEAKSLFVNFKPNPDLGGAGSGQQNLGSGSDHDTARTVSPVFYVNVDNDHLREVIDNLVENAIKYTPKGTVTIDVTGDDSHVTVSIADSGIGIPSEDIPHLFQKFYRVDNTDTREIGGTGLGLYLCRKLTEAMGGKIWVESTYKEGSTFYIQLPRVSSVDAQKMIEESAYEPTAMSDSIDDVQSRSIEREEPIAETTSEFATALDVAATSQPAPPAPTPTQAAPAAPSAQPVTPPPVTTGQPAATFQPNNEAVVQQQATSVATPAAQLPPSPAQQPTVTIAQQPPTVVVPPNPVSAQQPQTPLAPSRPIVYQQRPQVAQPPVQPRSVQSMQPVLPPQQARPQQPTSAPQSTAPYQQPNQVPTPVNQPNQPSR